MTTREHVPVRAFVDARGAYVRLTIDHFLGGRGKKLAQLKMHDPTFLQEHAPMTGDVEIGEGLLEIGELALVRGVVRRASSGEGALYRVSADARVHVIGDGDAPVDITDRRDDIERAGGAYRLPQARTARPGEV